MADEIELRYNPQSLVFASVALIAFGAGGVSLIVFGHHASLVFGVIAVSMSALVLIVIVLNAIRRMPVLILSADGICAPAAGAFSGGGWRRTPVLWSEISAIVVFPYSSGLLPGPQAIGLQAVDPTAAFWSKRRAMRVNQALTGYPIVMMAAYLTVTPEQLLELVKRFKPSITLEAGPKRTFMPSPLDWYPRPKQQ